MGKKGKGSKQPKVASGTRHPAKKQPKMGKPLQEERVVGKPTWRFQRLDWNGPWCPKELKTSAKTAEIIKKLGNVEHESWTQIKSRTSMKSHLVSTEKLCKEAQKRLVELKLDDWGQIFSLRLSSKERLWGLLQGDIFYALWWDPEHQVCPSILKHT